MSKKWIIGIGMAIIVIILVIIIIKAKNKKEGMQEETKIEVSDKARETGTGEEKGRSGEDNDDVYIYEIDPTYNPKSPGSSEEEIMEEE